MTNGPPSDADEDASEQDEVGQVEPVAEAEADDPAAETDADAPAEQDDKEYVPMSEWIEDFDSRSRSRSA